MYDNGVRQKPASIAYWPVLMERFYNNPVNVIRSVAFTIRSPRAGSADFLAEIRQAVWSVNSNLPLASVRTQQEIYNRSLAETSFTLAMLAIAGVMALLLGLVGIYGVVSYAVSQRRREIGIRIALGAPQHEVLRLFLRYGLVLAAIGVTAGLAAAAALTRLMSSLLFGITALDPLTYGAVPIVLVAAVVLATYLPARRAAAVDPADALRSE